MEVVDAESVVFPVFVPVLFADLPVLLESVLSPVFSPVAVLLESPPVLVASLSPVVLASLSEVAVDESSVVAVFPCFPVYDRSNFEEVESESWRITSGAISRLTASKGCQADGHAEDAAASREMEARTLVGRITEVLRVSELPTYCHGSTGLLTACPLSEVNAGIRVARPLCGRL